ncbi:hypothetical protein [Jeotgalibacillus proteolyticus]
MRLRQKWHQFWYFNYNYLLESANRKWIKSYLCKKSSYHGGKLVQLITF